MSLPRMCGSLTPGRPFADPDVEMVERARFHAHEHLIFARLRIGNVFVGENFGPTELMNANGFHKRRSSLANVI